MKKARMNISHSRFILFKLKIFGEIVTTYHLSLPDSSMYFSVNTMHEIWYGIGMEDCLPFHF